MSGRTLLLVLLSLLLAPPPQVDAGLEDSKIALHLSAHNAKSGTQCDAWATPCSRFATAGYTGVPYDMYMVVANGDPQAGISGLSCGIDYYWQPIHVYSWSFCGALEFPSSDWPGNTSGIRLTWNTVEDCQNQTVPGYQGEGVHAVAGAFYVYAYDTNRETGYAEFSITRHPHLVRTDSGNEELAVTSCTGLVADIPESAVGSVRFSEAGDRWGINPCPGAVQVPPPEDGSGPPPPPPPPPGPSPAPNSLQDAAIMLHVTDEVDPRDVCAYAPRYVTDIVTRAEASSEGRPYYVYVLGTPEVVPKDGGGLKNRGLWGFRLGIDYGNSGNRNALNVISWNACNNVQSPQQSWPEAESGNTLILNTCGLSQVTVAGYFYVSVYAPTVMRLAPYPNVGEVQYADCDGGQQNFKNLNSVKVGWVSMGGGAIGTDSDGCNPAVEPCLDATAVQPATWGSLKAKYSTN